MSSKRFLKIVFVLSFFSILFVASLNYIVDPYGIFDTKFFKNKPEQHINIRLVKASKVLKLKPVSISLGTSRTEFAYDPNHKYFSKPSYNLAVSSASLYETRVYLEKTLAQAKLKQVLLVLDWIMFNSEKMKQTYDFEEYFYPDKFYKYLLSTDLFNTSLKTIRKQKKINPYLENGQRDWYSEQETINKMGGHLNTTIKYEKKYYRTSKYKSNTNIYQDTKKSSFEDFRKILELCYKNDIKVDIIFGPSHIRQWEAYDYYQDINTWYKWKKEIVFFVEEIANKEGKTPYRIMDFAVYHELTAEEVPSNPKEKMKYYWEASHYKKELGDIVLDRLLGLSPSLYEDFGVEVNSKNIALHIENLKQDRKKFIDSKAYRKEVFDK